MRSIGSGTLVTSRTFAIIVIVEFLSLLASLLIATVGIGLLLFTAPSRGEFVLLGVGFAGVALFTLTIVVWYRRKHVGQVVMRLARLVTPLVSRLTPITAARLSPTRIEANLTRYYNTLDLVASDRPVMLYSLGFSLIGWLSFAPPLYTGALSIGLRLPLVLAMAHVPAAGLATVFPLPGGLGAMEIALAGLLAILAAIEFETAGTVVVFYRLFSYWFFVPVCGTAVTMAAIDFSELSTTVSAPEHGSGGDEDEDRL